MRGIYQDSFIDYLRDNLGMEPKITAKNIIVRCPWCEHNQEKDHYHLYIGLDVPIFNCFHAACDKHGILKKFVSNLSGHDVTDKFIDKKELAKITKQRELFVDKESDKIHIVLPPLNKERFVEKEFYIKRRLKF